VERRRPEAAAKGELVSEVDAVLKGGDGGAGELHGITAKLLEVMVWLEKGRGGLSTARWSIADDECGGGQVEKKSRKQTAAVRVGRSSRRGLLVMLWDQEEARRAGATAVDRRRDVVAGRCSGRGGTAWRARKKARGEELGRWPAWGRRVGAARVGGGAGRAAVAVSCGGLRRQGGSSVGRRSCMASSGKASRKG
jgi:hypothetical protein